MYRVDNTIQMVTHRVITYHQAFQLKRKEIVILDKLLINPISTSDNHQFLSNDIPDFNQKQRVQSSPHPELHKELCVLYHFYEIQFLCGPPHSR